MRWVRLILWIAALCAFVWALDELRGGHAKRRPAFDHYYTPPADIMAPEGERV